MNVTSSNADATPGGDANSSARPGFKGSFRLCRLAKTDVFIHWSWFIVAVYLIQGRPLEYSSYKWTAMEYIAVFAIVLLHELGHVVACRRIGGSATRILLWPLGGLAIVSPPLRPKALFWTIAAGPAVNLLLVPILFLLKDLTDPSSWFPIPSDENRLITNLAEINVVILVFNLLPIFPLDGGQLLHSLLWRLLGQERGLMISASIGVIAACGLAVLSAKYSEWMLFFLSGFLALGAMGGLARARLLSQIKTAKLHEQLACPNCGTSPPIGRFWRCSNCFKKFDLLAEPEDCPKGIVHTSNSSCLLCNRELFENEWVTRPVT